jgi:hypothetical protein
MRSRSTPIQTNYPIPEDFVKLAKRWHPDAIDILLGYVWQGFDKLETEAFDVSKTEDNIEDDITYAVYCRIHDTMPPSSPYQVVYQPPERERKKPKGQAPSSDLGFRLRGGNIRSHFTIEAKVIPTERAVSKYINEIKSNLLIGRYSTFSSEAAMLGYVLSGSLSVTFEAISKSLQSPLYPYPAFKQRHHRYSDHKRRVNNTGILTAFRCHHLLILFHSVSHVKKN